MEMNFLESTVPGVSWRTLLVPLDINVLEGQYGAERRAGFAAAPGVQEQVVWTGTSEGDFLGDAKVRR